MPASTVACRRAPVDERRLYDTSGLRYRPRMPSPPAAYRRAKIVCTIGPASESERMLGRLIDAGMDVARLNFSHGENARHETVVRRIRDLAGNAGRTVAVLQDLQGPKLRVGALPESLELKRGDRFALSPGKRRGERGVIPISYPKLAGDVRKGDTILLDDGLIEMEVAGTRGRDVTCRVVTGGTLGSHKGINIPGRKLSIPAMTAKDRRDLEFGLGLGVDMVALSFVREAEDVHRLTRAIRRHGADVPVIAKLEKPQAVDNLDAILASSGGIMVARGDLGVEVPPERVPVLQKSMIRRAREAGRAVITATQMLESMVHNPRPTRAEVSDVANAVFDGTDAVMLSGETAAGSYPVEAVRMMGRIIASAEGSPSYRLGLGPRGDDAPRSSVTDAIGEAACGAARETGARAIVVFTQSGGTALLVARYRPLLPIVAFTPVEAVARRLALVWGVEPRLVPMFDNTDAMISKVVAQLRADRRVRRGDFLVITAGTPVGRAGSTNFLKVHRVE